MPAESGRETMRAMRTCTVTTPDIRGLSDDELMRLLAAGEPHTLEILLDRHGRVAYSLAYRMCGSRGLAEDVVQEAFLSLWRCALRYDRARGSVRSFLLRIVHNRAIDTLRRSRPDQRCVSDDGIAERLPALELTDAEVERRDEARRIREALEYIPAAQRQVIELAYFDALTHTQIAQLLGLPAGTVKGRMRLGLAKLRTLLAPPEAVERLAA